MAEDPMFNRVRDRARSEPRPTYTAAPTAGWLQRRGVYASVDEPTMRDHRHAGWLALRKTWLEWHPSTEGRALHAQSSRKRRFLNGGVPRRGGPLDVGHLGECKEKRVCSLLPEPLCLHRDVELLSERQTRECEP